MSLTIDVDDVNEEDIFFTKYYSDKRSCSCFAVCVPDLRARNDPELLDVLRSFGRYQYRLKIEGATKKGWLIEKKDFPRFLESYHKLCDGRS